MRTIIRSISMLIFLFSSMRTSEPRSLNRFAIVPLLKNTVPGAIISAAPALLVPPLLSS